MTDNAAIRVEKTMSNTKDAAQDTAPSAFLEEKTTQAGPQPLNSLDHLAYAIMVDSRVPPEAALAAIAMLRASFVDWNEIRVARVQELSRAMGGQPWAENVASRIIEEYNAFFEKRGSLSFDFLVAAKAAEGRKLLQQYLPRLNKGAYALLVFQFIPGAAMPLSDGGLKAARKFGLISKSGDRGQLARTLLDSLEGETAVKVLQYLELDAIGTPYGEAYKPNPPAKQRKTASKKKK